MHLKDVIRSYSNERMVEIFNRIKMVKTESGKKVPKKLILKYKKYFYNPNIHPDITEISKSEDWYWLLRDLQQDLHPYFLEENPVIHMIDESEYIAFHDYTYIIDLDELKFRTYCWSDIISEEYFNEIRLKIGGTEL